MYTYRFSIEFCLSICFEIFFKQFALHCQTDLYTCYAIILSQNKFGIFFLPLRPNAMLLTSFDKIQVFFYSSSAYRLPTERKLVISDKLNPRICSEIFFQGLSSLLLLWLVYLVKYIYNLFDIHYIIIQP